MFWRTAWTVGIAAAWAMGPALGAGGVAGRISGSNVYVRNGASLSHYRLGKLQRGDRVTILRKLGDWYEIAVPPQFDVYVSARYVKVEGDVGTVTGDRVNARPTAGTKRLPMGQFRKGDRLSIRRKAAGWLGVAPTERIRAYISARYVVPEGPVPAVPAPVVPGAAKREPTPVRAVGPDAARVRPAVVRRGKDARLRDALQALHEEVKKPLAQWSFDRVRGLLEAVAREGGGADRLEARRILTEVDTLEKLRDGERTIAELKRKREAVGGGIRRAPAPRPGGAGGGRTGRFLAVGWVQDQGLFLGRHGSHKLVQGKKTRFYLRSDRYDLDGYINRRIGIVKGRVQQLPEGSGADLITIEELVVLSK